MERTLGRDGFELTQSSDRSFARAARSLARSRKRVLVNVMEFLLFLPMNGTMPYSKIGLCFCFANLDRDAHVSSHNLSLSSPYIYSILYIRIVVMH